MNALKRSSLLALSVMVALSGCSSEEEPAPVNGKPTLTLSSQTIAVNEGEIGIVSYTVSDDESSGLRLNIIGKDGVPIQLAGSAACLPDTMGTDKNGAPQLKTKGGCVSITQDGKINYAAPWLSLSDYRSHSESFIVRATDGSGAYSEQTVTATVKDKVSIVKLGINPPSGASGYQNTQKEGLINFWYPESTSMELAFDVTELDQDEVILDYTVTEGVIYKNQIQPRYSDDRTKVFLTVPVPAISVPSADIVISLLGTDGDGSAKATANITVVNKPALTWAAAAPTEVSEKSGGQLPFLSSEAPNYPGTYEVKVTLQDGSTPSFELPVSVSSDKKSVVIGASSGFQGDQTVQVDLTLTNKIAHAGGESYNEVTRLTRIVTLKDDRDDDFELSLKDFYKLSEQVNTAKVRRDEDRVASAYSNYFFLNGMIKSSDAKRIRNLVSTSLDREYAELSAMAANITKGVDDNLPVDELESLISDYTMAANQLGHVAREALYDEVSLVATKNAGVKIPLKNVMRGGGVKLYSGAITHYIGNSNYGTFEDAAKTKWVFSPGFEQLSVVDYSGSYCF